jgi:hypothetical protein
MLSQEFLRRKVVMPTLRITLQFQRISSARLPVDGERVFAQWRGAHTAR